MSSPTAKAGRSRYLTPGHIRFFRAAMEGIDLRRCWDYVVLDEDEYTPQLAKATMHWVRETTIAACMSSGHPELVGLFRREPNLVKVPALPSLDEFIAEHEHGDAFSESEMLELYQEKYETNSALERRSRLQARLRQAFDLLAKAVYRAPKADDAIEQWLTPNLTGHLQAAGMRTLGDVRGALDKKKTARWDEVPGIGEKWATRLTKWMDEHVIVVPPQSNLASRPTGSDYGIVPLERLSLTCTGSLASVVSLPAAPSQNWTPYPAANNRIGANSDADAIERWVSAKAPDNANTQRSYRRIAERLLLWCRLERLKTFAQMNGEDCGHYRAWLSDLGRKTPEEWAAANWRIPTEAWLGRRGIPRNSVDWRPFEGALSKSSIAQDLTVLRSFFNYLHEAKIVDGNPFLLMGKANFTKAFDANNLQFVERGLTVTQRDYLMSGLDTKDEVDARLLLALWLGFGCGLRAAEMLALNMGSIGTGQENWYLRVLGKGGKVRRVPLSTPVRNALIGYMATIGVDVASVVLASSGLDHATAALPLLRTQRGRRPRDLDGRRIASTPTSSMSYQTLNRILKEHFEARSRALESADAVSATRLRQASAHWLRHSCASQAIKGGVALNGVQKLLGHSSIAVTGRYVVEDDEALSDAMEAFLTPT